MRITEGMLQARVDYLNKITGLQVKEVKYNTVGAFILDHAYGGVALYRVVTKKGGVNDIFNAGHMPKRELFNRIYALRQGIEGNY